MSASDCGCACRTRHGSLRPTPCLSCKHRQRSDAALHTRAPKSPHPSSVARPQSQKRHPRPRHDPKLAPQNSIEPAQGPSPRVQSNRVSASATLRRNSYFVSSHDLVRKLCNISGSCLNPPAALCVTSATVQNNRNGSAAVPTKLPRFIIEMAPTSGLGGLGGEIGAALVLLEQRAQVQYHSSHLKMMKTL